MQMSELSRASGVPVATVKYYLRDGLLPAGTPTSATRAIYDDSHLRRLRLIRALVEVGHLRLDAVRSILDAVDREGATLHETVGAAHTALAPTGEASSQARRRVDRLLRRWRWHADEEGPNRQALALALDALDRVGFDVSEKTLDAYADAADAVAKVDVESVPVDAPAENAVQHVVVGTVLFEPVLLALRRLAHENLSRRRLARRRVRTARPTRG
jgi:DNA-binding transcriptional MerR regulator